MIKFGVVALFVFSLVCFPRIVVAQSDEELASCVRLIEEMCGEIPIESPYVKVGFRCNKEEVYEDLDRGWVLKTTDESVTILNDRLLVREYSTRISENMPGFQIDLCEVEPLSRTEHMANTEKRKQIAKKYGTLNSTFQDELNRYPYFKVEASRLVHLLIQSRTHRSQSRVFLQTATDLDFESAYYFRINGCAYDRKNSWGENAIGALSNCFLTQIFTKISDTKRVSVDECLAQTNKMLKFIDSGALRCERLTQLQDAAEKLSSWKKEKSAIENRLLYFPTPDDILLNFLMSISNIPGDRATMIKDEDFDELKRFWSEKIYVDLFKTYRESSIPTRHVVAHRGQEPVVLTVGELLEVVRPSEYIVP